MEEQLTIVDKIRALANAQGYSLPSLEIKLKLGNGTISRWSKSSPNTDKLAKVADFFHVSIDYLLGRENFVPTQQQSPVFSVQKSNRTDSNTIRIAGRDGSFQERHLTDEQVAALKAILDQMPDVPDGL